MNQQFRENAEKDPIRIPEVFWKIVFDDASKTALMFIAFNSPCIGGSTLLTLLNDANSKCTRDLCSKAIPTWTPTNNLDVNGMVYCCETVKDASTIFQQNADKSKVDEGTINELSLLKQEVQDAKVFFKLPTITAPPIRLAPKKNFGSGR